MLRRKPLKRKVSLKPKVVRKPIRKVNPERKAREFARAYHSKERVAFVKALACVGCGYQDPERMENAHIRGGGARRKADYTTIVPLCGHRFTMESEYAAFHAKYPIEQGGRLGPFNSGCHRHLHDVGRALFEQYRGINLDVKAAETEAAWQAYNAP